MDIRKTFLMVIACLLLNGYASTQSCWQDPETKELYERSYFGYGLFGTPMALGMHEGCESEMEKSDYTEVACVKGVHYPNREATVLGFYKFDNTSKHESYRLLQKRGIEFTPRMYAQKWSWDEEEPSEA